MDKGGSVTVKRPSGFSTLKNICRATINELIKFVTFVLSPFYSWECKLKAIRINFVLDPLHVNLRHEVGRPINGKGVDGKVIDRLKETYVTELPGKDFAYDGENTFLAISWSSLLFWRMLLQLGGWTIEVLGPNLPSPNLLLLVACQVSF